MTTFKKYSKVYILNLKLLIFKNFELLIVKIKRFKRNNFVGLQQLRCKKLLNLLKTNDIF